MGKLKNKMNRIITLSATLATITQAVQVQWGSVWWANYSACTDKEEEYATKRAEFEIGDWPADFRQDPPEEFTLTEYTYIPNLPGDIWVPATESRPRTNQAQGRTCQKVHLMTGDWDICNDKANRDDCFDWRGRGFGVPPNGSSMLSISTCKTLFEQSIRYDHDNNNEIAYYSTNLWTYE